MQSELAVARMQGFCLVVFCLSFVSHCKSKSVEGPPSIPKNVRVVGTTARSMSLTWDEANEAEEVTWYIVALDFCIQPGLFDCAIMQSKYKAPLKNKIVNINYLIPNMEYTVTVRAENARGSSRTSKKIKVALKKMKDTRRGFAMESRCAGNLRRLQAQGYSDEDGVLENLLEQNECNVEETKKFITQIVKTTPECTP